RRISSVSSWSPSGRAAACSSPNSSTVSGLATLPMIAKRPKLQMASRNRSSRFPARSAVSADRPVTFPPGRARLATKPTPTRCDADGDARRRLLCRHYGWGSPRDDDVDFEPGKLGRDLGQALAAPVCPAIFDRDRAALDPTEVVEPPRECCRPLAF